MERDLHGGVVAFIDCVQNKRTAQKRRIEIARKKRRFQRLIAAEKRLFFDSVPNAFVQTAIGFLFCGRPFFFEIRIQRASGRPGSGLRFGCAASQRTKAAAGRLVRSHEGPGREPAPGCARQMPRGPAAARVRSEAARKSAPLFWARPHNSPLTASTRG